MSAWSGWSVTRRQPVAAVWGGYASSLVAVPPAGQVQPQATFPLPRRYPARGQWRGQSTPQPHVPGSPPPPAGAPVTRRPAGQIARAVVGGRGGPAAGQSTPQPHVPGQVQPRATVPVPRRAAARALQAFILGPANAHGPAGSVQPRATVPVPRRTTARAVTASVLGALNAHGPSGSMQPRATVPVPRRIDARGTWASVLGLANAHGGNGTVQPLATRQPRRTTSRAAVRGTPLVTSNAAPSPPVSGTVQPAATAPHRPHAAQRVIWRGNAVPGVQPQAATGGLVRRRTAARGLWRSVAGPPPPSAPAVPVTGGTVKRRTPARGQWRGPVPVTSNAHGPAVPAPKRRPDIPRRTSARAVTHGMTGPANALPPLVITTGDPFALWEAGTPFTLWETGDPFTTWAAGTPFATP